MDILRAPLRAAGRVALAAMFVTGGADACEPRSRTAKADEAGVPSTPTSAGPTRAMLARGPGLGLWRGWRGRARRHDRPTTWPAPYWEVEDPAARRQQRIHFFKNLGLLGGALLVCAERPPRRR